jgi:hypothetical protein
MRILSCRKMKVFGFVCLAYEIYAEAVRTEDFIK